MSTVRVRFAPSPTGALHIGGVRTALFNWLFARHHQGSFILRIEDTDQARSTDESIRIIINGMKWLGMDWDEGPSVMPDGSVKGYRQTERMDIYREYAEKLLKEGKAYRCYCSPEELESKRKAAMAAGRPPKYDRTCFGRKEPVAGRTPVLRFHSVDEGQTIVRDLIRGAVTFENQQLDDLIIMRSDGFPTYNFAVVVDDITMNISHVIRGDDHLNNTPRQVQIYRALGQEPPAFAHLPMILGPDKTKLSKRHGATAVTEYVDLGFLPEALMNYVARLGWSHGDQEIFSVAELIEKFSLESVGKAPSVFNQEKCIWLNHHYIQQADPARLAGLLLDLLKKDGVVQDGREPDAAWMQKLVKILTERSHTLVEMKKAAAPFLSDEVWRQDLENYRSATKLTVEIVQAVVSSLHEPVTPQLLSKGLREKLNTLESSRVRDAIDKICSELENIKGGKTSLGADIKVVNIKAIPRDLLSDDIAPLLTELAEKLKTLEPFTHDSLEKAFNDIVNARGLKLGKLAQPVRVALTGGTVSPGIFDVIEVMGRDKVVARIEAARALAG